MLVSQHLYRIEDINLRTFLRQVWLAAFLSFLYGVALEVFTLWVPTISKATLLATTQVTFSSLFTDTPPFHLTIWTRTQFIPPLFHPGKNECTPHSFSPKMGKKDIPPTIFFSTVYCLKIRHP